jgi:glycosyltransferase involved in cell wall biosynthesis
VYVTPAMQRAIDELAREQRFDLVLVEFAHMAGYVFPTSGAVVLDEHNIEYDILRRTAEGDRAPLRRAFNYLEYRKLRSEERRAWARADGCMFTSERDRDLAVSSGCEVPTAVVPNGVDVTEFAPAEAHTGSDIVFVGADFYPNNDAIRFYADEVLPEVLRGHGDARLVVVGGAANALRDRTRQGVVLLGVVENVREHIARAAVVIAPLRVGGGTRLKILEAMAMARPVVATRIGAEGIDALPGQDILIADDPRGLARETLRLLADPDLARSLGAAGRELAQRRYDWDVLSGDLRRFARGLLAPRRAYRLALGRERAS